MYIVCHMCICARLCVSVCVMFALVKFHVTERGCLTLWEITELNISWMVPLLSAVQTVVEASWAEEFQNLLRPPQQVTAFSREMVRRGVIPGPMWQRDISQGFCHLPGKSLWKKNCDDKPAVTARAAFHAHVPARAIRKVFGSAAHTVVPAWLGQGVLAFTDRRKN